MAKKKPAETPPPKKRPARKPTQDATDEDEIPCFAAAAFKMGTVNWLWPATISFGGLTFLDGDPEAGKSSILFDLAARVTTGRKMPDGSKGVKGDVLILIGEDDACDLALPRLHAAKADLSRVHFFGKAPDGMLRDNPRFPAAAPALLKRIEQHKARLVIFDPYMPFLAQGLSPYSEQDVRAALGPVSAVLQKTKAACVMIRHPNKNEGQNKLYRGGGSLGIAAVARTVLWATQSATPDAPRTLIVVKNNLAAKPAPVAYRVQKHEASTIVKWEGSVQSDNNDNLAEAEMRGKRVALEDAERLLQLALKDGPKPANTLLTEAETNGIGRRTLMEAKAKLEVKSKRKTNGEGKAFWEWTLPKK